MSNDNKNAAPIALFVYNRPWHTRETVEALLKNELAAESELIVFSDAPKSKDQEKSVSEVRQYIRHIVGFKTITIFEREINFGLAHSIIDGVTSIVNKHGRIIVLEDDLISSPYFLSYMNDALDVYQDEEKVMHLSGYMFPVDTSGLPETFFLRTTSSWGWGTWKRAWKHFIKEPKKLLCEYTERNIYRFNMDGSNSFWMQVKQNEKGLIDTWAVFWYASVFQLNGLCLHPYISLINNIGNDNTGTHCKQSNAFFTTLANNKIKYFEKNISENYLAHARTKNFFISINPFFLHRIYSALKNRIISYF